MSKASASQARLLNGGRSLARGCSRRKAQCIDRRKNQCYRSPRMPSISAAAAAKNTPSSTSDKRAENTQACMETHPTPRTSVSQSDRAVRWQATGPPLRTGDDRPLRSRLPCYPVGRHAPIPSAFQTGSLVLICHSTQVPTTKKDRSMNMTRVTGPMVAGPGQAIQLTHVKLGCLGEVRRHAEIAQKGQRNKTPRELAPWACSANQCRFNKQ